MHSPKGRAAEGQALGSEHRVETQLHEWPAVGPGRPPQLLQACFFVVRGVMVPSLELPQAGDEMVHVKYLAQGLLPDAW